jgi:hypothetical protein
VLKKFVNLPDKLTERLENGMLFREKKPALCFPHRSGRFRNWLPENLGSLVRQASGATRLVSQFIAPMTERITIKDGYAPY